MAEESFRVADDVTLQIRFAHQVAWHPIETNLIWQRKAPEQLMTPSCEPSLATRSTVAFCPDQTRSQICRHVCFACAIRTILCLNHSLKGICTLFHLSSKHKMNIKKIQHLQSGFWHCSSIRIRSRIHKVIESVSESTTELYKTIFFLI
jgi:hypothetical protein